MQAGNAIGRTILGDIKGKPRKPFRFRDKGQMATIGRNKAIVEMGNLKINGAFAWLTWLLVHIYYLSTFRHRVFVLMQWAWSYFTFGYGARLIVNRDWRFYREPKTSPCDEKEP